MRAFFVFRFPFAAQFRRLPAGSNDAPDNGKQETRNEKPAAAVGAFTLLEVVVGILLTALVVTAAAGVWNSSIRGWTFAHRKQETSERDELAARRIRELFERALIENSSRDTFEWQCERGSDGSRPADRIRFTTQWPVEFDHGRSMLVPVRGELALETSYRPGGAGPARELVWKFAPFTAESLQEDGSEKIVLSSAIRGFSLRYFWKESGQWIDQWREKKKWPSAVEIKLTFEGPDGATADRTFIVAIGPPVAPLAAGDAEPQTGGGGTT